MSNIELLDVIPQSEWDAIVNNILREFKRFCSDLNPMISYDDLHQEAWFGILKACDNFDINKTKGCKFTTYAYTSARWSILNYISKQSKSFEKTEESWLSETVIDDELNQEIKTEISEIKSKTETILSDYDFNLIKLRYIDGLTLREIGKRMGRSHTDIDNKCSSIMKRLEHRFENH